MSKSSAQELVTFIQREAGELVRSVAYFDENTREVLYARDDVTDQYSDAEIDAVFTDLAFDALGKSHTEQKYVHGELNCIVRCFADAIELHFPHGKKCGTAMALEPHAVTDLEGLISDCLNELYGEYPPAPA